MTVVSVTSEDSANPGLFGQLEMRWNTLLQQNNTPLFNWKNPDALMREVTFVNSVQEKMDEVVARIAPSMLRIVNTVRANLPSQKSQREWISKHLNWDFRRISELCIVASSYNLLNPHTRQQGAAEMQRYGWSSALKLAYIRTPAERGEIWRAACAGRPRASYRDVLNQINSLRNKPSLPQSASLTSDDIDMRLNNIRTNMAGLGALTEQITDPQNTKAALQRVSTLQRELQHLKKALQGHLASSLAGTQ